VLKPERLETGHSHASRHLLFLWFGLLVVIILAASAAIWDRRETALARARQETSNLGIVLAEQTARSIQAVDLVLQEVQAMVHAADVDNPAQLEHAIGTEEIHRFLADRLKVLPLVDVLGLVDPNGKLINGSRAWPMPAVDLSDRDYFQYWRDHDEPGLFINAPAASPITDARSFVLSRRIDGAGGALLGLVISQIDIRYLETFYQAIALQDGGSVAVFRRDGTMLARHPRADNMLGQKLARESPFYMRVEEGGGTYRSPGYVDGIARVVSIHPLRDFPLVVAVSMSEDAVLGDWRRQSMLIALGTLCTIIGFTLLFRVLVTRSHSLEGSEATLRESEARCRDFALTTSDWFWETDAQHRFTYLSDHIRAFGQDPETRIGRTRIDFAADIRSDRAKWQEHLAVLDRHEPFRDFVYTRKGDGPERSISVSGNPFFGEAGQFLGYRGTASDITDKVLAERALREAKAAAEAANLAKSQFLANMSHELRTPLNAILGFSEVLENGIAGPLQPRQTEYVGLVRQSGGHLLHIINEILDLVRIDAGTLELHEELVDPRRLADQCLAIVQDRAAAASLRLSAKIAPMRPPLQPTGRG
jgi:PAS domain S-box-containing protein